MKSRLLRGNQAGFSLAEILIAIASMSMVLSAASTFFNKRNKEQRILSMMAAKGRIVQALESAVTDPNLIITSVNYAKTQIGPNQLNAIMFDNCVRGACPSYLLDPDNPVLIDLYHLPENGFYPPLSKLWTADGSTPYSASAPPTCQDTGQEKDFLDCPFNAQVRFWFTCATNVISGSCPRTSHANLTFSLVPSAAPSSTQNPNEFFNKYTFNLYHPNAKPLAIDELQKFAFAVETKDLLGFSLIACPAQQFAWSFTESGKPLCACLVNPALKQTLNQSTNVISPSALSCPAPTTCSKGVDNISQNNLALNANNCNPPVTNSDCTPITLTTSSVTNCPPNTYVTHLTLGQCTTNYSVYGSKKYASNSETTCGASSALCCPVVP